MRTTLRIGTALAAVMLLVGGCAGDDGDTASVPSTRAPSTTAVPTTAEPTTAEPTATAPTTEAGAAPAGLQCVQESVVQSAVASFPPFHDNAWVVDRPGDPCATLAWVMAVPAGATASSPVAVLFFHDNTYLGTGTSESYAFTDVVGQTDDTVTAEYRWLGPNDPNATPTGGPAVVRYQWNGSSVEMLDALPAEVTGQ